ncbi:sensor histidine kinase [Aestuariibacter salexigens]|uniref:sensor histidine kinase n=1 Tax=Aestuariibacter salexigens TaxID=226010 RepID=UPI0003F9ABA9|nr:ATP-binding protein [Aestuariibacter salexigens]
MNRQFFLLATLLLAMLIGMLIGFNALYDRFFAPPSAYLVSTSTLFTQAVKQDADLIRRIDSNVIQFPPALQQQLEQGQVVALKDTAEQLRYYQHIGDRLYELGPLPDNAQSAPEQNSLTIVFYSLLGAVVLIVLYPVARDIVSMRRAATSFAETPAPIRLKVSNRSVLYPLAESMQHMSARIAELLKQQQDLANTVAHEIRTPLARMEFVLQKLHAKLDETSATRLQADIDEINQLVADYLTFARTQNRQQKAEFEHQCIAPLFDEMKSKTQMTLTSVKVHFCCEDTEVAFDYRLISMALQNLLNNAMRYANTQIRVSGERQNDDFYIIVEDDGEGLNDKVESLTKAFNRQAKDSDDMGFGLGLYIVERAIQLHNGRLSASRSQQLGGARFTLSWPITDLS